MSRTETTRPSPGLAAPETDGRWLRPSTDQPAEPRWGHPDGIQVGLHPIPGPRGLLRVFAPYLEHPRDRLVNFIAIEPIPAGATARGLSELEPSTLDPERGKRFWSADSLDDITPHAPEGAARGVVTTSDGIEYLTVFVLSERFDNGASVAVRMQFRADRPHEVTLAAIRLPDSVELDFCVLSATMGNFARLRRVQLVDRVATPAELWPGFEGVDFAEHAEFSLDELPRTLAGEVEVSATTDEADPASAVYGDDVAEHWKYFGKRAVQTWTASDPDARLRVLVNARAAYWASTSTIPGGASFENFEFKEPFRQDREFRFSIEPLDQPPLNV